MLSSLLVISLVSRSGSFGSWGTASRIVDEKTTVFFGSSELEVKALRIRNGIVVGRGFPIFAESTTFLSVEDA
jgi:hypothetical protein